MRRKALFDSKARLSYRNAEAYRLIGQGFWDLFGLPGTFAVSVVVYSAIALVIAGTLYLFGHAYLAFAVLAYAIWDTAKFVTRHFGPPANPRT
jgi:hypothetical protein